MSAARTERLLNLLTLLLNTRRPISLREIREMSEFNAYQTRDPKSGERAFERDKAALVELGVPLQWIAPDHDGLAESNDGVGGYVIDRDRYFMPELELSASDLALLSMVGSAAAAMKHFPDRAAMVRALAKLGFDEDPESVAPVSAHVPLLPGVAHEQVAQHLNTLQDAVGQRRRVRLRYPKAEVALSADVKTKARIIEERLLDPYGLYYRNGAWYCVGFCHLRQAERTFHVARIIEAAMGDTRSIGADFEVPTDFSLADKAAQRPWQYPYHDEEWVTLKLAAHLGSAMHEIFGPQVKEVEASDESEGQPFFLVRIASVHHGALLKAILPYGADIEVIEPKPLRERMATLLSDMVRRYAPSLNKASEKNAHAVESLPLLVNTEKGSTNQEYAP